MTQDIRPNDLRFIAGYDPDISVTEKFLDTDLTLTADVPNNHVDAEIRGITSVEDVVISKPGYPSGFVVFEEIVALTRHILVQARTGSLEIKVSTGTIMTNDTSGDSDNPTYLQVLNNQHQDRKKENELQAVRRHFIDLGYSVTVGTKEDGPDPKPLEWQIRW